MATSCGAFAAIFPLGLIIALGVWVISAVATRYVSISSMAAAVAILVAALVLQHAPFAGGKYITSLAALAAILAIVRHRSNIRRLMDGSEDKIGAKTPGG